MIHCVLHDPNDSVAVVVVEGVKAGATLTGLVLDEDRTIALPAAQDIPIGHKVALKDMAVGDTVIIAESRPISKDKNWTLQQIIRRGTGEPVEIAEVEA